MDNAILKEKSVRDLSSIIDEITKKLLTEFEASEQKEILLAVKNQISKHYENIRQEHITEAQFYAEKIEMFNSF